MIRHVQIDIITTSLHDLLNLLWVSLMRNFPIFPRNPHSAELGEIIDGAIPAFMDYWLAKQNIKHIQ